MCVEQNMLKHCSNMWPVEK